MIKAALLDVDGTLVLSNDAHALAWVSAFAHLGYQVGYEKVRPLIGMGSDKIIPKLVPDLAKAPEIAEKISTTRSQIFLEKYAATLQPAPGSRDLVKMLKEWGLKVMVASSAKSEELSALLGAARVDDLLEDITTSSDADESKPAPDIIHAALAKLGLSGPQTFMVGDTPYDVEAAARAGVPVIAVLAGGWSRQELEGAAAIYDNPADIVANGGSLPLPIHRP